MNINSLNSKLSQAIKRYRIASLRLLAKEESHFDFTTAETDCDASLFEFLNVLGDKFVFERRRKLPSTGTILRCAAIQDFIFQDTENRSLLTKDDVSQFFPALFRNGLPRGYFVDSSNEHPKLGLLRVDCRHQNASFKSRFCKLKST